MRSGSIRLDASSFNSVLAPEVTQQQLGYTGIIMFLVINNVQEKLINFSAHLRQLAAFCFTICHVALTTDKCSSATIRTVVEFTLTKAAICLQHLWGGLLHSKGSVTGCFAASMRLRACQKRQLWCEVFSLCCSLAYLGICTASADHFHSIALPGSTGLGLSSRVLKACKRKRRRHYKYCVSKVFIALFQQPIS